MVQPVRPKRRLHSSKQKSILPGPAANSQMDASAVSDSMLSTDDAQSSEAEPTSPEAQSCDDRTAKRSSKDLICDVMNHLEKLIMSDEWVYQQNGSRQRPAPCRSPLLDELSRSVLTSYSLQAYARLLNHQHKASLATYLFHHTSSVITKMFNFTNAIIFVHEEKFDGLLRVVRIALHAAFPDLAKEAVISASEQPSLLHTLKKQPIIYVSGELPYTGVEQFLAFEVGFATVKVVPAFPIQNNNDTPKPRSSFLGKLDLRSFEALLEADVKDGKVPVMLCAAAGNPLTGECENLVQLLALRDRYRFWLHLDGFNVASLCLPEVSPDLKLFNKADSVLLPLGSWIGVPSVPFITIHRACEVFPPSSSERLASLPWWVVTRHLGAAGIRSRIQRAFNVSGAVSRLLTAESSRLQIYASQGLDLLKSSEKSLPPPVFLFKYNSGSQEHSNSSTSKRDSRDSSHYFDSVNTWLGQGLQLECPAVGFHTVHTQSYGLCIRFCPLETVNSLVTTDEHVEAFGKQLQQSLAILDATLRARARLPELVKGASKALAMAHVPKWAGVGAVIFVPSKLREIDPVDWNSAQKQQASHLNIELVHELRASDTAFSIGQTSCETACVKFGMLADDADLLHLIDTVSACGQRIEESSQYIESLAELVRQGIDAATQDLRKENERVYKGAIRQVPVVGPLLRWFSPREEMCVGGRAFDLVSGQMQNTETVYAHKLQSKQNHSQIPAAKAVHNSSPEDN